jgi:hypothetical protein
MSTGQIRSGSIPATIKGKCILLGTRWQPPNVVTRLDRSAFLALDELADLYWHTCTTGLVLRPNLVWPIIGAVNFSLRQHGWGETGLWTLPPSEPQGQGLNRADRLGLDVPAAWGVEWLACQCWDLSGHLGGKKNKKRAAKAASDANEIAHRLWQDIERATGFGGGLAEPNAWDNVYSGWAELERAFSVPFMPVIDWDFGIPRNRSPMSTPTEPPSCPEPPHAA